MEKYESVWKKVKGSEPLDFFGFEGTLEPESVNVNLDLMVDQFKTGYQQFSPLWKEIFSVIVLMQSGRHRKQILTSFTSLQKPGSKYSTNWPRPIIYGVLTEINSLDLMTPLYFARVASFVRQSWDMSSAEAEALEEEQAIKFEEQKDYLIKVWDEKSAEKKKKECGLV